MGAEDNSATGRTTSSNKRETRFVQLNREYAIDTMDAILVQRGHRLEKMVGALTLMDLSAN